MSTLGMTIVSNALMATLLAVVAAIVGHFWKNPAALHLVWIAVLVKLFTPAVVMIDLPLPAAEPVAAVHRTVSQNDGMIARVDSSEVTSTDQSSPESSVRMPNESQGSPPVRDPRPVAVTMRAVVPWLITAWVCGSIVIGALSITQIWRFARFIRHLDPAPPSVQLLTAQTAARLGIKREPTVWMTKEVLPPLVWSIGSAPKIILPSGLFERLSLSAQAAVLAHELVHIRRGDYLVRLLEAAAAVMIWWHPVVWWACWQIRELEEQCCDSRVLELHPDEARTYALTLMDTVDFLSEQSRIRLPLPTAMRSTKSLTSRIRRLASKRTNRLNFRSLFSIAALIVVPMLTTFAADPDRKSTDATDQVTILEGQVLDEAGKPLVDARVKVALSEINMRFLEFKQALKPRETPTVLETTTGEDGQFQLKITGLKQPTKISIDAMKSGYRKMSGTFMQGGEEPNVTLRPGASRQIQLTLKHALHFSGVVVDEHGKPIPNVDVHACANSPQASGGVEHTVTNGEGRFELFNYSMQRPQVHGGEAKGVVYFSHSDYIENQIADVYGLGDEQRETLRIVLSAGRRASGTVMDAAGKKAPNVMVKLINSKLDGRKAVMTDANGHFELRGLREGQSILSVMAWEIQQKFRETLNLERDFDEKEIRLQQISLPKNLRTVDVLGMQMTDLTEELTEAFDLDWNEMRGALILDPGHDFERFKIGTLKKGFFFFMVGEKSVHTVREFAEQLIQETGFLPQFTYSVRIVYGMSNVDFDGTNTQYMNLHGDDIVKLKALLEQLPKNP